MGEKADRFRARKQKMANLKNINRLYEVVDDPIIEDRQSACSTDDDTFSSLISQYNDSFNVSYDKSSTLIWKHGAFEAWCSWCLEHTLHGLDSVNGITRNDYRCNKCQNYTVKCRVPSCCNMATYKPESINAKDMADFIRKSWASEYCAEHDGSIASFEKLNHRLTDISDFREVYENRSVNVVEVSKQLTLGAAVTGSVAVGGWLAAPWVASSLGSLGLLGTSSTGTLISTLSGAALKSASLAAIGPGGMAGGVGCISAAGAALGAKTGAAIGAGYFGDIEDFDIIKVREGEGPALIFINGYLSQKSEEERNTSLNNLANDWLDSISEKFPNNPCYIVTWEASTLRKLGTLFADSALTALKEIFKNSLKGVIKSGNGILTTLQLFKILADNPWHKAMYKAEMTGVLLADILARTDNENGFILLGHSLGARVVFYALEALGTREDKPIVESAYLLGGAVGCEPKDNWNIAAGAVKKEIYNVSSKNDQVLRIAYKTANVFLSNPIGLSPIEHSDIINIDASVYVSGHTAYKEKFSSVLNDLL